jgi:hypothetical protein
MTGDLVFSRSTGKKSVIFAVPVKQHGEVVGGPGASAFLDDLSERNQAALSLPATVVFFAPAPDGASLQQEYAAEFRGSQETRTRLVEARVGKDARHSGGGGDLRV